MAVSDFWVDYLKGMTPIRPWDKLVLGNYVWPGLAIVEPSVKLSFEVAKQNTQTDASQPPAYKIRIADKGYEPAQIRALLQVWTVDQWADLKALLPKFSPKTNSKTRDAYDISHPATTLLGIKSVIVNSIAVRSPVNQTLYVEFEMTQWFTGLPFKVVRPNGGPLNPKDFMVTSIDPGGNLK